MHRVIVLEQKSLRRNQSEGAKRDRLLQGADILDSHHHRPKLAPANAGLRIMSREGWERMRFRVNFLVGAEPLQFPRAVLAPFLAIPIISRLSSFFPVTACPNSRFH